MKSSLDLVNLAETAARRAAAYLRTVDRPRNPDEWSIKARHDFVSKADRDSEQMIRDILLRAEPDSSVVGEELSPDAARRGLVWIVDPLDGTTNFLHRFPVYSVSIAAEVDGTLEAGVVYEVEADRAYRAWRGGGAWVGDSRLAVSSITDPYYALIGTGFPFKRPEQLARYQKQFHDVAVATSGIRRAGSAALDLAWVAAGSFDGFWELELAPWDIAAGVLLVREAEGVVTDLSGEPIPPRPTSIVAGNPAIHSWLLDTLNRNSGEGLGSGG